MKKNLSEKAQTIVRDFNGAGDDEIIEYFFDDYFKHDNPWVKEALSALGIADHEVVSWGYFNLK